MRRFNIILLCLTLFIAIPVSMFSANATEANEKHSLNLSYVYKDKAFKDVDVKIYQVAEIDSDGKYDLIGDFAKCSVKINGLVSQAEWNKASDTLNLYVGANKITADKKQTTDKKGNVKFSELNKGLYLVYSLTTVKNNEKYVFDSFLITVDKNVSAKPKCEVVKITYKPIEYEVIIQWDDLGNNSFRPVKVTLEIYKSGQLYKTVELTEEDNWSFSWLAKNDRSRWSVLQKDIPDDYTYTIEEKDNKFIVINRAKNKSSHTTAPQTGDYITIWPYVISMSVSGMILLFIAIIRKRRGNIEEE